MLWIKALHIVFIASWFAGLFYLPRIFVNLAMVEPGSVAERARLLLMSRKLYRFMNLLMLPDRTLFICDTYVNYDPSAEQIAEMEARLGCRLFERGGGVVRITEDDATSEASSRLGGLASTSS